MLTCSFVQYINTSYILYQWFSTLLEVFSVYQFPYEDSCSVMRVFPPEMNGDVTGGASANKFSIVACLGGVVRCSDLA